MSEQSANFINGFDVEPQRRPEPVDVLTEGAQQVIRHRPGFLSLTVPIAAGTPGMYRVVAAIR